jgi:hypothetical protein
VILGRAFRGLARSLTSCWPNVGSLQPPNDGAGCVRRSGLRP